MRKIALTLSAAPAPARSRGQAESGQRKGQAIGIPEVIARRDERPGARPQQDQAKQRDTSAVGDDRGADGSSLPAIARQSARGQAGNDGTNGEARHQQTGSDGTATDDHSSHGWKQHHRLAKRHGDDVDDKGHPDVLRLAKVSQALHDRTPTGHGAPCGLRANRRQRGQPKETRGEQQHVHRVGPGIADTSDQDARQSGADGDHDAGGDAGERGSLGEEGGGQQPRDDRLPARHGDRAGDGVDGGDDVEGPDRRGAQPGQQREDDG